jgi:hypothetical protein
MKKGMAWDELLIIIVAIIVVAIIIGLAVGFMKKVM